MEKYIQKYLSEFYYIDTSDVGNDGIYYTFDHKKIPTPINSIDLIDEITKIFESNNEDTKRIIDEWAFNKKENVNLDFFWMTNEQLIKINLTK